MRSFHENGFISAGRLKSGSLGIYSAIFATKKQMIPESPIPGSDRNARNKKKPVYLAHARCFLEAEDAEGFIKNMGYTVKEVRKHYMKGTDITLYVLDYVSFIQSKKQINEQL